MFFVLLGRNGAGKTTLFNCINSDITKDAGECYLIKNGQKQQVIPEHVGYVLSAPTVPEFLTAREFLKFFIDINSDTMSLIKPLDVYFDEMRIEPEDRDRLMKVFAQGPKTNLQLRVYLLAEPENLRLDYPLTSLDVVVAEEMKQLLRVKKDGRITIFSTHIMDLALDLCDVIVLLSHGELEVVENENLGEEQFKEKIIAALKDEAYDVTPEAFDRRK